MMSSVPVCDHFQLHTWKKDTCANCLQPKKQHALEDAPQPAKRLSKVMTTKDSAKKKDEVHLSGNDKQENSMKCLETIRKDAKQMSDQEIKRHSLVGSPKPVPLKAKPLLASNADKTKKPPEKETEKEDKTVAVMLLENKKTNQQDECDLGSSRENIKKVNILADSIQVGDKSPSESCLHDSDKGTSAATQKVGKLKMRPQMTPPQVPDVNKMKADRVKNQDPTQSVNKKKEPIDSSSNSHYYQIYDISAKGMSGKPEPLEIPEEEKQEQDGLRIGTELKSVHSCRALELLDDEQNTAMPYNVVDVTTCPLTKEQSMNKAPPQLPSTPAPNRASGVAFGVSSTLPSNRIPPTKDLADLLKSTAMSPKAMRKSVMQDIPKAKAGALCSVLSSNSSSTGKTTISLEEKLTNEDLNKDLYEDIGGSNSETDKQLLSSSVVSGNNPLTTCSSNLKFSAFESKMAALAKLDLSKAVSQGTLNSTVSQATLTFGSDTTKDIKSVSDKQESLDVTGPDSKSGESNTFSRQEKSRKSGGKSFFQKFLKRGNKESTVEQSSYRSSPGNITIEPILNVCTSEAENQLTEQSSSGDVSPSVSAVRPFLPKDKPLLFPLTSGKMLLKEVKDMNALPGLASDESKRSSIAQKMLTAESGSELEINKQSITLSDVEKNLAVKSLASKTQLSQSVTEEVPVETVLTKESLAIDEDQQKSCLSVLKFHTSDNSMQFVDSQTISASKMTVNEKEETLVDTSPTLLSVDRPFATLGSTRNSVHKDSKSSKAPRKMVAPPPLGPPPPPPSSGSAGSKDADLRINSEKLGETGNSFMCHTLPRVSVPSSSALLNSVESNPSTSIDMRHLNLASKNARNKTMSEGMRFEKVSIAGNEVERPKCRADESSVSTDTLERRSSKFMNRALPDPPPSEPSPDRRHVSSLDEIDNLYELVSQTDSTQVKNIDDEQMTYEDIDNICSQRNQDSNSKTSSASSSQRSVSIQDSNQNQGTSNGQAFSTLRDACSTGCSYYLEPVSDKEKEESEGRAQSKVNWRPCPAPRTLLMSKTLSGGRGGGGVQEEVSMPYVNTQMMNDQMPLNINDGFSAIADLVVNVLHHLTDQLYSHFVTQFLKNRSDVVWTDFELFDLKPEIVQETSVFFRAKHLILAPSGCILMVMRDYLHGSGLFLEPNHANIISPLLCFSLTASDTEIINGISGMSSFLPGTGTAAVLLCQNLSTVDVFWDNEHSRAGGTELTVMKLEQSVCHCLVEILNAILYLRDSGCSVLHLSNDDVLMAKFSDSKWHPLIKPSVMTFDVCADRDTALLSIDIIQLLCRLLKTDSTKADRVDLKIVPRTKYSRGLQRIVRMLQQKNLEGLESSRNLLEFLLWGPSEEEAKLVAMTETREMSFRVWLEVARCRMASELVLHSDRNTLELANQARFLCRVTENLLLGVTKLLFE